MKKFCFSIIATIGLLLTPTAISHADKINLRAVNANIHRYYRTNKAITIKVGVHATTGKHYTNRRLTIPKNTIISSDSSGTNKKGQLNQININIQYLSYAVKKPILKTGNYLSFHDQDPIVNYSAARFTRIKRPAYRLAYSSGDLYAGKVPQPQDNFYQTNQVMITTDGYLEYYRYEPSSPTANPTSGFKAKPTAAAKIIATKVKGNSRWLYTKTNVKGTGQKHIHKSGNYRYRLRITNLHDPQTRNFEDGPGFYSYYTIGGKRFYTLIGNDSF